MQWHVSYSAARPRIAILASRAPHCLLDLLWRWRSSELAADVAIVISNHETLREHVASFDVPYVHVPVTAETKPQREQQMIELLRDRVDLVVLTRYMQVLTPSFLDEYPQAVINIHHSFLPAFAGADPYGQAMQRGVKIIGATAHYATPELDAGPIIEQDVARVSHRDTRADLVRHGREIERAVLARAVRWHIEDRVLVYDNKDGRIPLFARRQAGAARRVAAADGDLVILFTMTQHLASPDLTGVGVRTTRSRRPTSGPAQRSAGARAFPRPIRTASAEAGS